MAALVQSFPSQQSSAPVSLMQPRSQPSTGALHGAAQGQSSHQPARYSNNRGYSTAPVATYAFTSTPSLATKPQSAPGPSKPSVGGKPDETRQSYTSLDSINPEAALRAPPSTSRSIDDTTLQQGAPRPQQPRPLSTSSFPQNQVQTALPSPREKPDRYKRVNRNSYIGMPTASAQPSGPGMTAVAAVYAHPSRANSSPNVNGGQNGVVKTSFIGDYEGQLRSQSVDDIHTLGRPSPQGSTSHGRRRSVGPGSITTESFQNFLRQELAQTGNGSVKGQTTGGPKSPVAEFKPPMRPGSRRTGSTDSSASGTSSRASSNRNSVASNASNPAPPPANSPPHEIPPRSSSADVTKRMTAPSPLSKSAIEPEVAKPTSSGSGSEFKSTAAEHLNAVNDGQKKGVKNRLRRAFSFGSAAELRKASAANHHDAAARARSRQELFQQEQDVEQARIARRQEAAGLGESIYSGQGNFFAGSTDNISVSSTASSASIMIRKMGKGIKRSSRSLVGIFRPKSSHGSESGNTPLSPTSPPSTGPVTMITVEAERERVNVNANVTEHVGGGTGFPKLERNSLEMPPAITDDEERRGSVASSSRGRRSIVGGEQERAEILAAVRKGILKQRSGSASPVVRPAQGQQVPEVPQITGAENQRPSSGKKEGGDYFMPAPTFNTQSHSAPTSPMTHQKYNVSFSPRITFHDTWPSQEYDRRGEVATCNRLTPVLAQQIKEELNTFKMEMEVHEQSKMYTHFF
ncbi:hypothetical protein FPQ18DRAFT_411860 [Pyronema domesticum]|uniref:Similar to Protein BNI4 acc. no. P53858 n=1 Tax=Pyronema omphalodes (strain CBS 100304) TaxID=1076935 RepID=U4L6B1_PYROM|nr:hypothetical protein FPQ18DRAFT_411860 [Pyronema domesticum]CCX12326.1 Similar to Protein BNI4; acc. no. P53858 [Pyronema omphalodes CBS 100304]